MNLSYLAGLVDGEGCIRFSRCRTTIFPMIIITNTNREILEDIKNEFGGDIQPLSLRKENWKQGYSWRLSWSRAVEFLDKINPWLRIKHLQAQTIFAWNAIRPNSGGQWDDDALKLLTDRMTWLNKKGDNFGPDPIEAVLKTP